jgi:hypothetical protein
MTCHSRKTPDNIEGVEDVVHQVAQMLKHNRRWLSRAERLLADDLIDYLAFKISRVPGGTTPRQVRLASRPADNLLNGFQVDDVFHVVRCLQCYPTHSSSPDSWLGDLFVYLS